MKIRTGDKVEVISGKDKKTRAEVLKVFKDTNKVLVKGVNVVTRHIKKMGANPGQIVKMEKAIDVSNVMLVCPFTDKVTKVGFVSVEEKGKTKKYRFSKVAVKEQNKKTKDVIIK
ncbi:MAG: 50S ribosomal protein L24 [Candidatus Gracilibacteria bacterium]|nr:50S ribosomal protein L24 [Candidatus Gracilibacteria bacterium]